MQILLKTALAFFIGFFLVSCGSGDSGASSGNGNGSGSGSGNTVSLVSGCSGTNCGNDGNAYSGYGVGIWHYKNTGLNNVNLNVSLSNVADKNITIVFTNEGDKNINNFPYIYVDNSLRNKVLLKENDERMKIIRYTPEDIDFDFRKFRQYNVSSQVRNQPAMLKTWYENDKKDWRVSVPTTSVRQATLKKQKTVPGRTINFWVEDSEFTNQKIDQAKLDDISQYISTIYTNVVNVAGEPWGEHSYSDLLIPSNQPLNIVFFNFDNNNKAEGIIGYFASGNNFLKSYNGDSNEELVIFVDTEIIYLGGNNGPLLGISTIAHELTHAIHFYQRAVKMGDPFDTFLNEMAALMMEDIISKKIGPDFNDAREGYINWIYKSLYNCDFSQWGDCGDSINSYSVSNSFGTFLLRQHGVDFYKTLFTTYGDNINNAHDRSINILDKAIKSYNGKGLTLALQRWGASIAMLPTNAPMGFGYPAKNDNNGFVFDAFDGNYYAKYRQLPSFSPSMLLSYSHFPFLRQTRDNTFTEFFTVPSNVSVTVVVK
jgi:hypothetical protein